MSLSEPVTKKKRERPSGHSRKKIAKEKSQRELELFKKMPPLDSFFSSNVAVKKVLIEECVHFKTFVPAASIVKGRNVKPSALSLFHLLRSKNLDSLFPNIDIALRMFLSTPCANCSAERSFSALKRVKGVLRSTMGQNRLNSLSILAIESEVVSQIDFQDIIQDFASAKVRRKVNRF